MNMTVGKSITRMQAFGRDAVVPCVSGSTRYHLEVRFQGERTATEVAEGPWERGWLGSRERGKRPVVSTPRRFSGGCTGEPRRRSTVRTPECTLREIRAMLSS